MPNRTEEMLAHIDYLARQLKNFDPESICMVMLMELEVDESYFGFEYLRVAVEVFSDNPLQSITQSVYPAVAERFGSGISAESVERAIRTAIRVAWKNHSEWWDVYFSSGKKPSNKRFIAKISRYISIWKIARKEREREAKEGVRSCEN